MNNLYILVILLIIPVVSYFIEKIMKDNFHKKKLDSELTGFEVVRKVLDKEEMNDTYIVEIKTGDFTDHYDNKQNVVRLSTDVYHGMSFYSTGVALYYASQAILNRDDKYFVRIKKFLDTIIEFGYILIGILLLMWIFVLDNSILLLADALLSIAIAYEFLTLPLNFKVADDSIKRGLDNELIKKEDEQTFKKISRLVACSSLNKIIILINKGVNNLVDSIKRS
ncbi:MAG TPA: zinc metallopeptidase [Candidatus Coprovivens excrementavium]|nr:zinc metallopeptidase [Candidatus Coprovivens excrementavium]